MAAQRQIEANRRNALKSVGPRSEAGKALVALNALRHGLTSRRPILPGEEAEVFAVLAAGLRAQLQPEGELEEQLVERIAAALWRLQRVSGVEAAVVARESGGGEGANFALAFVRDAEGSDTFSRLRRYETTLERSVYRALHELERRQAARAGQDVPLPGVLEVEGLGSVPDQEAA